LIVENIHILPFMSSGEKEKKKNSQKERRRGVEGGVNRLLTTLFHCVIFSYGGLGGREASLMVALSTSPGLFDPVYVLGEMPICFSNGFAEAPN